MYKPHLIRAFLKKLTFGDGDNARQVLAEIYVSYII